LAEWKAKYDEIYELSHFDKKCWIHNPDRNTMSYALSKASEPFAMVEALIKNCWLGGDEEFKTDARFIGGQLEHTQKILGFKEISLKKL